MVTKHLRICIIIILIFTALTLVLVLPHLNMISIVRKSYEELKLGDVGKFYGFVASPHAVIGIWAYYKSSCVYVLKVSVGPNNDNYAVREFEIKLLTNSPFYHLVFVYSDSYRNLFEVTQTDQKTIILRIRNPLNGVLYTFRIIIYDMKCRLLRESVPIYMRVVSESGNNIVISGGFFRISPGNYLLTSEE
ncbi:MAG: hypothetical protein GXO26_03610 [Crenarchaeota archaeon]|nr:hypothetical protein [Thermoproteota archaeon]